MAGEKLVERTLALNVTAEGMPPHPNAGQVVTIPATLAREWDKRGLTVKPPAGKPGPRSSAAAPEPAEPPTPGAEDSNAEG